MIYGFCAKIIEKSMQFQYIKKHNSFMTDKELCIHTLHALGLRYHLRIMYDTNIRVSGDNLNYYITDMYFVSDTKAIDIDDELVIDSLTMDELKENNIDFHPISGCGWNTLYANDKDYYNLTRAEIENCMRGAPACLGD